jgi:hypothetical protein
VSQSAWPHLTTPRGLRASSADTQSREEAPHGLVVAVVLLAQVASHVLGELVCSPHTTCAPISCRGHDGAELEQPRTVQSDYATGLGDDAHGADILLPQGVLHTGDDGANEGGLDGGARSIREGVLRVEGRRLGGHGGQSGRRCRCGRAARRW